MGIREEMPLLRRHEGEWKGTYIHVDASGNVLDRHESHLTCRIPPDAPADYHQINRYLWADGRREEHHFPAAFKDGKIWFDTERMQGHAWEIDENTMVLTWRYKADPETYLYEMIQLSSDGNHRARTWHWFQNGELIKRTLIKETRIHGNS